jgi:hypothetical protein
MKKRPEERREWRGSEGSGKSETEARERWERRDSSRGRERERERESERGSLGERKEPAKTASRTDKRQQERRARGYSLETAVLDVDRRERLAVGAVADCCCCLVRSGTVNKWSTGKDEQKERDEWVKAIGTGSEGQHTHTCTARVFTSNGSSHDRHERLAVGAVAVAFSLRWKKWDCENKQSKVYISTTNERSSKRDQHQEEGARGHTHAHRERERERERERQTDRQRQRERVSEWEIDTQQWEGAIAKEGKRSREERERERRGSKEPARTARHTEEEGKKEEYR